MRPATAPAPHPGERADLALLTGEGAAGLVAAALGAGGRAPGGLRVDVVAVHHRPGAGVSVCYAVEHDGVAETLVASTAPVRAAEGAAGVVVLDDGSRRVRVWRRDDDPALPGLREAVRPDLVARWLGLAAPPRLDVVGYRPTRRAVIGVRGTERHAWAKVVRPDRADDLAHRHEVLAAAPVPAPAVIGRPAPGVVLLAPAAGRSLAHALASGDPRQVPDPEQVLAALDGLPAATTTLRRRPSWTDRLDVHATGARATLPVRAEHVEMLESRIGAVLAGQPPAAVVPTHGDLHVANLFVDGGVPVGLIDVDSLGPGHRADDLATMLAHLAVLPALAPTTYPHVPAVLASWTAAFGRAVPMRELLARTAAVLVSLVSGATPDQANARLDLALATIARAEGSPA